MAVVSPPASSEMDLEPESGLELEQEESGAIRCPFDPAKIKMLTVDVVVDQIVARIDHGEIDLGSGVPASSGDMERSAEEPAHRVTPVAHSHSRFLSSPRTTVEGDPSWTAFRGHRPSTGM